MRSRVGPAIYNPMGRKQEEKHQAETYKSKEVGLGMGTWCKQLLVLCVTLKNQAQKKIGSVTAEQRGIQPSHHLSMSEALGRVGRTQCIVCGKTSSTLLH